MGNTGGLIAVSAGPSNECQPADHPYATSSYTTEQYLSDVARQKAFDAQQEKLLRRVAEMPAIMAKHAELAERKKLASRKWRQLNRRFQQENAIAKALSDFLVGDAPAAD